MDESDLVQLAIRAAMRLTDHPKAFAMTLPDISARAAGYTDEELLDVYALALVTKSFAASAPRKRFAGSKNRALEEAGYMGQQAGFCAHTELRRRGWPDDRIVVESKPFTVTHLEALVTPGA